jgi:hypothetical protein
MNAYYAAILTNVNDKIVVNRMQRRMMNLPGHHRIIESFGLARFYTKSRRRITAQVAHHARIPISETEIPKS